jgi:hypothetical protein
MFAISRHVQLDTGSFTILVVSPVWFLLCMKLKSSYVDFLKNDSPYRNVCITDLVKIHKFCLKHLTECNENRFCSGVARSASQQRIWSTINEHQGQSDMQNSKELIWIRQGCIQNFPDWPPGARTANRRSFIAILSVSLVSFAAITLCVASEWVFIVVSVYFVTDSGRKLLVTPSYIYFLVAIGKASLNRQRSNRRNDRCDQNCCSFQRLVPSHLTGLVIVPFSFSPASLRVFYVFASSYWMAISEGRLAALCKAEGKLSLCFN